MTTFLHRATCWLGLLLLGGSSLTWGRPGPDVGPAVPRTLTVRLGPGTEAAPRLALTNDDGTLPAPGGSAAAPVAAGAEAIAPATATRATSGNINKLEYFIDADPGYGSGVNVPITAGATVANVSFSISLSAVSYGFHRLTTRSRDVGGVWSVSNTTSFYYQAPAASGGTLANINKVEYFIDADPGIGSGINVPVAAPATTVSGLAFAVNLTPVGYGFHRLSTRTRDVNGKWSLTNTTTFYYQAPAASGGTLANINKVEYFIDADPGFGSGINVPVATPAATVSGLAFAVNLTAVGYGFHRLSTRSRDVNGKWSLTNTATFYYQAPAASATLANINKVEYFIDADPGLGSGINVPVATPATTVGGLAFAVNLTPVGYGFHRLSTRSRDVNGVWGLTNTVPFYYQRPPASATLANINKIEYFIDADPGIGNGINVPVTTPATTVSGVPFVASLGAVSFGFHRITTRTRDVNGVWSISNSNSFYYRDVVAPTVPVPNITRVEYFFDADPGFGSATSVPIATPAADLPNLAIAANASVLTDGPHLLSTRSRDANGKWSLVNRRAIGKNGCASSENLVADLPAANYTEGGSTSGNSSRAFNSAPAPATPDTQNSPYVYDNSYFQIDLGAAKTLNSVGATFTPPAAGSFTMRLQTATAVGGPYTTVNTYTTSFPTANISYSVTRTLTTPATGVRAVRLLFTNGFGNYVVVSSAGVYNYACVTPTLASTPAVSGTIGSTVTLNGTFLQGPTTLTFSGSSGNTVSSGFVVNAAGTQITGVVVPSGAVTGSLTATTPNGTTNTVNFKVVPALASISPTSGVVGTVTTLTGTGLTGASVVTFAGSSNNTVASTGFTVNAAGTQISNLSVPSGAITGLVTVTTPGGTSNGVTYTVLAPQLAVSRGSTAHPSGGTAYSFGSQVIATSSAAVAFTLANAGTAPLPISSITTTGDYATSGTVPTSVATGGSSLVSVVFTPTTTGTRMGTLVITSSLGTYTVNLTGNGLTPAPVLSGLNPTSGPVGTSVTITGTALGGATSASFNGTTVASASFTSASATSIVLNVPTGATTGNVTVTTPGGTSNGVAFTVTVAQLAVSQSGTAYPSGGATYGFGSQVQNTSSSAVAFTLANAGTAPLVISGITTTGNYATSGSLPGSVAAGGSAPVSVVFTPTGTGVRTGTLVITSNLGTYTVNLTGTGVVAPPSLTSLNPTSGPVGTSVTLTGTDFGGASSVSFNGTVASNTTFTANTGTSITLPVPGGASTGLVTVTTSGGTSNGVSFTVTVPQLAVSQSGTAYPSGGAAYGFGNQVQNTSSAAVSFTLSNPGTAPLTISGITTTGNYATSGSLPGSVAAGGSAPVSVVFTPTGTGVRTGMLVITSNLGTYTVNLTGTGVVAPPSLTSLNPTSGPVGTSVTLTGTDFGGASSVSFNSTTTTAISNNTGTTLVVSVPGGATTGNVTVTTPGGTSNGVAFTVTAPQLAVSQSGTAYPSGGAAYGFGSQVQNTSSSAVAFTLGNAGTAPLSVSSITTTGNYATSGSLPTSVAAGGSSPVSVVFTPLGTGVRTGTLVITSSLGTYTVNLSGTGVVAVPTLASLNPTSGPVGTSVTLTGTDFVGASSVSFNSTTTTAISNNTGTTLVVSVPGGATTGNVTVTTPGGTSNGVAFTVTAPQLAVSQSGTAYPSGGAAYGFGNQVQNTSSSAVAFTLGNAGTATLSISSITTTGNFATSGTLPTSVAAGGSSPVSVVFTPTATGARTGTLVIVSSLGTYMVNLSGTGLTPAPVLTSLNPTSGLVGTSVTLSGTSFGGATSVSFNGTTVASASFTSSSGTSIVLNVPSGASTGLVTVTTPAGTSNGVTFTVTAAQLAVSQSGTAYPSGGAAYGFGNQVQNTSSSAVAFTLANAGTATLTISGITSTGDFATSGSLPSSVAAGGSSPVSVVFTPTATGARTGTLVINSSAGTYTVNLSGTGLTPTPVLSSLSPTSGVAGTSVTLTGTNLSNASSVSFNGTTVTSASFTSNAGTSIVLNVPTGATTGLVTVTTAGGTSNGLTFTVTAPQLAVLQSGTAYPSGGAAYVFGNQVIATGSSAVAFTLTNAGTAPLPISSITTTGDFATSGSLPGNVAAGGTAPVSVVFTPTAAGARTGTVVITSSLGTYTLNLSGTGLVPAPTLTGITPASGIIGSTIALTGTNLTGTTTITFSGTGNNTVVSGFTVNGTGTQITGVIVPAGATTGTVTVTTNAGTSNGVTFTLTQPDLTISSGSTTSPVAVAAGTYNSITVTGTGVAQLAGNTVVNTSVTVQADGLLLTNCQLLTGAASFTLAAGATLGICDAAGIAGSGNAGAVRTTGTRSFSPDASYLYNGTVAQVTGAGLPATVRNLTTDNAQPVSLTGPVRVRQVLTVAAAGNFALNGQALTLPSDATGTALVVNSGSGLVSGPTATMQRHLTTTNLGTGYRHYSSPVSGATVNSLATAGFTPVINTAYNNSATPSLVSPFPTVFAYDQGRLVNVASNYGPLDKGWYSPAASTSPLAVGQGYTVHIAGTQKVALTGTLNSGDRTVSLARTSGATAADGGWALVGNPYPAPIDWSAIAPADRANVDAAMYVFESSAAYAGAYRSYVNGIGGGSPLIGSSQGFFVRVSSGQTSGALTFRNSQRLTTYATQVTMHRGTADARPQVQLRLAGKGLNDDVFVYCEAGATAGADPQFDATKLPNPHGLNLAAVAAGTDLAVQGLPSLTTTTVVPLAVRVPGAGTYAFSVPQLHNVPASTRVYLTDALTGQRVDVRTLPATGYAFTLTAAQAAPALAGRFALNLVPAPTIPLAVGLSVYPNPARHAATVTVPAVAGADRFSLTLLDVLGRPVRTLTLALPDTGTAAPLDLTGLATGVYVLKVQAGAATTTRQLIVE